MEEFVMAHAQVTQKERHKFLIPIMLEDVTTINLNDYPDLQLYLTTHTYLKVNKDKNQFLKRVLYAMPIRSLNQYELMHKTTGDLSPDAGPSTSTQSSSNAAGSAQSPAIASTSPASPQPNRHGVLGEKIRNRMAKRYQAQQRSFANNQVSEEDASTEISFQEPNTPSESSPLIQSRA